jgi:hypothetical protein
MSKMNLEKGKKEYPKDAILRAKSLCVIIIYTTFATDLVLRSDTLWVTHSYIV